ncbi:hypothetical protein FNV43_RR17078 [Rhamnella rubrinervis]|uniref:Transposase (putative) gypsy type domain-containing protein n=1 Tax=Rhamnella rubrinervis TaxID=2594499 RepID=A0A8K0GZZ3_9ROSA|nr:hypothetical protein FNV43_RR17078 [Rhamnella rubrinervis]
MESPGSDLVVEEQLVRKNSKGRSSSWDPGKRDDSNVEIPIRTPSIRVDGPNGNRSGLITMRPVVIKTDIPSVFKQGDMSYLKERFDMPSQIKLSAPGPLERADSPCDGWICLYEIAFKIGLRLPFHRIINMVPNFYSIALGQLIPNSWRYLLGLIVQSEKCDLRIDMATFLTKLTLRLPRAFCPYFPKIPSVRPRSWLRRSYLSSGGFKEEDPPGQKKFTKVSSSYTQVPYLHVLEGCIRLLYGMPTDPLWASYPAADMGKLKMKISKAELEATKKKKKEKQAATKGGASSTMDKGQERPTLNIVVESSSLPIAISSGDSPPSKRPRRSPRPLLNKGKEKQTPSMLGLEDSSTIRSNSSLVGPIVDSLMTRHDRSLLREMTLDEVGLEAEQNALKFAQNARRRLEGSGEAKSRKDRELEALRLDYAQVAGEKDALQAKVARWPRAKKHIYKKAAIDAILKNTNDMIRAFKAGQTEDWVTPDPSDEEEGGQEDMEITSGEDEPDDGDTPPVNQPEAPGLHAEPSRATSNDSFEEAMRLPLNEESGTGQTSHTADTDVGAQD